VRISIAPPVSNMLVNIMRILLSIIVLLTGTARIVAAPPPDETVTVLDQVTIAWDQKEHERLDRKDDPGREVDRLKFFSAGQIVQAQVTLPARPANQRDARRILVSLEINPVIIEENGVLRPGDPWNRLGSVCLVLPQTAGANSTPPVAMQPTEAGAPLPVIGPNKPPGQEVELMRFITGFGAGGSFQQDVTALAPLLHGPVTLRVNISTFRSPAWTVTLKVTFTGDGVGYRRPVWASPLFQEDYVVAERSRLTATVDVPKGLERPRLIICSTGHATDGAGGDEFISRTHILRIDGREVARWRPWAEDGGARRAENPMSGRENRDGRELWSSELDRSGWIPGRIVWRLRLPVPELTPGKHQVDLEIVGIRRLDEKGRGYWRTSMVAVADEPWPDDDGATLESKP